MHCPYCNQKNIEAGKFCTFCGKSLGLARPSNKTPSAQNWTNILAVTAVCVVGLLGVYLHPLLEVSLVAYIAVIASTAWVFADSQKYNLNRWPWTLGTLVLWILVFPLYLWKTRRFQGLVPGATLALFVVLLQLFPNFYPAKKHFRRALIFANQQRLTKAEEAFKLAIKKNQKFGEAHLNLGILYMSQGLLEAAEKEFTLARDLIEQFGVRAIPENKTEALSLCLSHLAAVYALRTSEAIQILDRLEAKRNYEKALNYANEALKLDGNNVRSLELLRRLKNLSTFLE